MKIIAGLGNPDIKYQYTKHNIGFMVMDRIAREHQAALRKNPFEAEVAEFFRDGEKILLVKPQTFVNKSDRAIGLLMTYFGIYPEELIVIYDDLDLAVGKIRLRQRGSVDGHNGIKNIISCLNINIFDRVKMGAGRPEGRKTVVQHVFSPFNKEDRPLIEENIFQSIETVEYLIEGHPFVGAMNQFN